MLITEWRRGSQFFFTSMSSFHWRSTPLACFNASRSRAVSPSSARNASTEKTKINRLKTDQQRAVIVLREFGGTVCRRYYIPARPGAASREHACQVKSTVTVPRLSTPTAHTSITSSFSLDTALADFSTLCTSCETSLAPA